MQTWIIYALFSAVFAALVAIFAKIGLKNIDSSLAAGIRTFTVLIFLWTILIFQRKYTLFDQIKAKDLMFIIFSGIAGGLSWLFYFAALKAGSATKVIALDRLSIFFVLVFSLLFLGEKFSIKVFGGIVSIIIGTLLIIA